MNRAFLSVTAMVVAAVLSAAPSFCQEVPTTPRTEGLIEELLSKLDSVKYYEARKEGKINALKESLPGENASATLEIYQKIVAEYSKYNIDSSLFYLDKSEVLASENGLDSLRVRSELIKANLLAVAGYHAESLETVGAIDRKSLKGDNVVSYYNVWASLYHSMYSGLHEPDMYREKYRKLYNTYRDSLLAAADPSSMVYLSNMEKKLARAGEYDLARKYNAIRAEKIEDPESEASATRIYDSFTIGYLYEKKMTGEDFDNLLRSAILEVKNNNQDISSLLRAETFLVNMGKLKEAKKISDHYYASIQKLGSRQRRLDAMDKTLEITNSTLLSIQKKNREIHIAMLFILLLVAFLLVLGIKIYKKNKRVTELNEELCVSGEISKAYIGMVFQLYSSYIKCLDSFRMSIYTSLKKGDVPRAIDLTNRSSDVNNKELKDLFNNFDQVFLDLFPTFISTVNGCLKPECRIADEKPENLTTELRIIALTKLGISDPSKQAEMLHCSVKTIYNLRYETKTHLAVPEEEFWKRISDMSRLQPVKG